MQGACARHENSRQRRSLAVHRKGSRPAGPGQSTASRRVEGWPRDLAALPA